MLLRNSISNTKKLFKKTFGSFKSFFSGSYQRLPKTPPSFATAGIDMETDFNAERMSSMRQEKEVQSGGIEKNGNAAIERVVKSQRNMDNCTTHQRKTRENHDTNSECLRYDQNRMCLVAEKMKELGKLADTSNVDHALDIEEVLHYYSRLNCPVYLEIVDRFFMEVFAEFSVNSSSPTTCNIKSRLMPKQNLKVPTMGEMVEMWRKKHNIFAILYSWFLAKVANKLEVFPGSEFRVAYEEAMKYGGRVILGDRPVEITIRRTWAKLPLWHKIKLLYSFLFQAFFLPSSEELTKMLEDMDDIDMLTLVIKEMSKEFPTLMDTLIHERDQFMSSTLLSIAKENRSVVAVVGKGHMQGIRKNWQQPVLLNDILEMPEQKRISAVKIFTSFGVVVAGAAIVSGIYLALKK